MSTFTESANVAIDHHLDQLSALLYRRDQLGDSSVQLRKDIESRKATIALLRLGSKRAR